VYRKYQCLLACLKVLNATSFFLFLNYIFGSQVSYLLSSPEQAPRRVPGTYLASKLFFVFASFALADIVLRLTEICLFHFFLQKKNNGSKK
jgi:hypothetical protein